MAWLQNKKKKTTRIAVNEEAKKQMRLKAAPDAQSESHDLHAEVRRLRAENEKNALAVVKEMLKLMEELTDKEKRKQFAKGADSKGSEERPALSSLQMPTPATCTTSTPSRSPALQTASLKSPQSKSSSPIPSALTPIHGHLRKVFGYDVNNDGQVDLGYGVYVSAHNLQYVSKADPKKTTYMACEVVFTREELASSSMTGKKSNAFKDSTEKPQLDKNKVSAVVDFVKRIHISCEESQIRKMIAVKNFSQ